MQVKIQSVHELLGALEDLTLLDGMYRGQLEDWPLLPLIGRFEKSVSGYDDWCGMHEFLISRFIRLGRPHFSDCLGSDVNTWIQAQHHGLPTRLLDFSTNPLKALFFAVNDPKHDAMDGVFWVVGFESWREDLHVQYQQLWETELCPFLPEQLNARLTAQEGCFLSYPLPKHNKSLVPVDVLAKDGHRDITLTKFCIPKAAKPHLRRELKVLGCQFRLLFPDADGVARGIRLEELDL
jgi:hypothetical protein